MSPSTAPSQTDLFARSTFFRLTLLAALLFACLSPSPARAQTVDHSTGFAANGDLTANESATFTNGAAVLTPPTLSQAGSVFTNAAVNISQFSNTFTFSLTNFGGNGATPFGADGIAFVIQNDSPTALGGLGINLGYGGIQNSIGVKFDIYQNQGDPSNDCTGLFVNGASPVGGSDLTSSNVNLRSGDVMRADMTYDGTTLTVKITDTVTNATATQSYPVDIPNTIGSTTAYVGFSGGTGTSDATQQILTWKFATTTSQASVPTLTGLSPSSALAGSPAFTLTVTGSGFTSGAVVKWKGTALPTTFVSATQLTAAVPASDVATAGTAAVTATVGSAVSNALPFPITALTWKAVGIAAGPNGDGAILWTRIDGAASLWSLNAGDGETEEGPIYGPYSGWSAKAVTVAGDGTARVLWTNVNGEAGVWAFDATETQAAVGPTYGPYTGWTAAGIAATPGGYSHLLWTRSDGAAGVWTMNATGTQTLVGTTYGPYSGWTAKAIGTAGDVTSRLLWTRSDGAAGLWTLTPSGTLQTVGPAYGPYPGWSADAVGAAGDGTSRVLWTNVNGEAGLWSFGANDAETLVGPTYGPYAGYGAVALGVADDGTARVLWDRSDRAAGVWTFGANDAKSVIGSVYGPY